MYSPLLKQLKTNTMPENVKEHVKKRLAQVQDQLAIAIKYNDKMEIALYSYAERNLIKLNKLVNPELYK